jgi:hypothetical protein
LQVDPPDACENMEVFLFDTKFVDDTDMQDAGSSCPTYWELKNDNIKDLIKQSAVIDAFTYLVLNAYSSERLKMPACVAKDTKGFKVDKGLVTIEKALGKVVCYTGNASDSVSIRDIKAALEKEGVQSECCCICFFVLVCVFGLYFNTT